MDNQKLEEMKQFGLIDKQESKMISIVPRNKSWLEVNGILQYGELPVAPTIAQNSIINGVKISKEDYEKLLVMPYQKEIIGLEEILNAFEDSKTVEPVNKSLTYVMCEVYIRLKKLFPNQTDSWRKRETIFYFGGIPDLA